MSKMIVLFHGELDTINIFTDQLRKGLEAFGYDIYVFDLTQSINSLGNLYTYMQAHPITAMIGFNCAFFGLQTGSGTNVWEQLGIPCINILVDHPYWYRDILKNMPSNSLILCVDRNHMDFVSRFYPHIAGSGFIAHGGAASDRQAQKICERKIDVLYAGALYTDYVQVQKPNFDQWNFPAEQICEETIDYLLEDRNITVEGALEKILIQHQIMLKEEELCEFISSCVYIERVVSSYFREKIVSRVAKAGISMEVYGAGWEKCDWITLPNVRYGGIISPEAVLEKMEDVKIVLNTMPWFKDGSHERVFNGLLRGCVVVSETSTYLEETLPEDAWCHFSLADDDINNLPLQIEKLLLDSDKAQKIADAGHRIGVSSHTWQMRAREIHDDVLNYL